MTPEREVLKACLDAAMNRSNIHSGTVQDWERVVIRIWRALASAGCTPSMAIAGMQRGQATIDDRFSAMLTTLADGAEKDL